jgi:hypothetical protein
MNLTWCKYSGPILSLPALLAIGCCLASITGRGELKTFTLDATNSSLSISGTLGSAAFQQQGPGSLTTKISGTIKADVTSSTITFVGGSAIVGLNSGNWQPGPGGVAGSAPANYGMKVNVYIIITAMAAVRNALLDVASSALTVTEGAFPGSGLQFYYPSNSTTVLDYSAGSLASGSDTLTNTFTNTVSANATLIVQGAEQVLTIPVDISGARTITAGDVKYRLRGQLVARAPVSVPLQINAFQVSPEQITFTIATTPGQSYTILESTNLTDWTTSIDQFTATNNPTVRNVSRPAPPPLKYFRVRQD